jgi:hypothetical protein
MEYQVVMLFFRGDDVVAAHGLRSLERKTVQHNDNARYFGRAGALGRRCPRVVVAGVLRAARPAPDSGSRDALHFVAEAVCHGQALDALGDVLLAITGPATNSRLDFVTD